MRVESSFQIAWPSGRFSQIAGNFPNAPLLLKVPDSIGEAPMPRFLSFIFAEEGFDEADGVEGFDVFGFFAEADEFHRNIQLFADGDDHAAFGGAVELGEDDAGDGD